MAHAGEFFGHSFQVKVRAPGDASRSLRRAIRAHEDSELLQEKGRARRREAELVDRGTFPLGLASLRVHQDSTLCAGG